MRNRWESFVDSDAPFITAIIGVLMAFFVGLIVFAVSRTEYECVESSPVVDLEHLDERFIDSDLFKITYANGQVRVQSGTYALDEPLCLREVEKLD